MSRRRPDDDEDDPRDHVQEGAPQRRPAGPPPRARGDDDDYDDRPRRSRRDRGDEDEDRYSGIVPYRNGFALTGYYLSFVSLIAILGGIAFILYRASSAPLFQNPGEAQALATQIAIVVFGVIYGLGGLSSLLAIVFGAIGLSKASQGKGTAHSIVAIVLGVLEVIGLIVITVMGVVATARR